VKASRCPAKPNRERLTEDDFLRKLLDLLFRYRGLVRITILKNIALLTHALLTLFQGARGGNGWLSQDAYSADSGHLFQSKAVTCSGGFRPAVPGDPGHPIGVERRWRC